MTDLIKNAVPETFEPFIGEEFHVETSAGILVVTLSAVKRLQSSGQRDFEVLVDDVPLPSREAFALTLKGPGDQRLQQGTYRLTHAQMGPLDLFLTCFHQDATHYFYEALFS